jgi:hypothetical protein
VFSRVNGVGEHCARASGPVEVALFCDAWRRWPILGRRWSWVGAPSLPPPVSIVTSAMNTLLTYRSATTHGLLLFE